jgi:hypothetical protein
LTWKGLLEYILLSCFGGENKSHKILVEKLLEKQLFENLGDWRMIP